MPAERSDAVDAAAKPIGRRRGPQETGEVEANAADTGLVHRVEFVIDHVIGNNRDTAVAVAAAVERIDRDPVVGAIDGRRDQNAPVDAQGGVHGLHPVEPELEMGLIAGFGDDRKTLGRPVDVQLAIAGPGRRREGRLAGVWIRRRIAVHGGGPLFVPSIRSSTIPTPPDHRG